MSACLICGAPNNLTAVHQCSGIRVFNSPSELDAARAENERLRQIIHDISVIPDVLNRAGVGDGSVRDAVIAVTGALASANMDNERLRAELATCREKALEKAAKEIEANAEPVNNGGDYARIVRALKREGGGI